MTTADRPPSHPATRSANGSAICRSQWGSSSATATVPALASDATAVVAPDSAAVTAI
jgi:hypothetical protein